MNCIRCKKLYFIKSIQFNRLGFCRECWRNARIYQIDKIMVNSLNRLWKDEV